MKKPQRPLTKNQARLVSEFAPLVDCVVRSIYRGGPISREDFWSAGADGLVAAAKAYRDGNVPFGAYAHTRIKGAILDMLRDTSPVSRRGLIHRRSIQIASDEIEATKKRPATEKEICAKLRITQKRFQKIRLSAEGFSPMSLDAPLSNTIGSETLIGDNVPDSSIEHPAKKIVDSEFSQELAQHITRLKPLEQTAIRRHFLDGHPYSKIAKEIQRTESRVSQLIHSGLASLRRHIAKACVLECAA